MKEQAPSSAAATAVNNVAGLDAIDGTPVLDIQPVMREFLPRGEIRQPAWVTELMGDYWAVAVAPAPRLAARP